MPGSSQEPCSWPRGEDDYDPDQPPCEWKTTPAEEDVVVDPTRRRVVRFVDDPVTSIMTISNWYLSVWPHPENSTDPATDADDDAAIRAIDDFHNTWQALMDEGFPDDDDYFSPPVAPPPAASDFYSTWQALMDEGFPDDDEHISPPAAPAPPPVAPPPIASDFHSTWQALMDEGFPDDDEYF